MAAPTPVPTGFRLARTLRERFHPLHQLRRNRLARWLLARLDVPVSWRLPGIDWQVRLRLFGHLGLILDARGFEPGVTALFLAIDRVLQPRVFWDVGANIGYFSWLLKSRNRELQVVLFEPDPQNVDLLEHTIRSAGLQGVAVRACAVSDQGGEALFQRDTISTATGALDTADNSFVSRHYGARPTAIMVPTCTLDQVLQQATIPPDIIKIDVECVENEVLRGAANLLKTVQPLLIVECEYARRHELCQVLLDHDYTLANADVPDGPLDQALNVFALPARFSHLAAALRQAWRSELDQLEGKVPGERPV